MTLAGNENLSERLHLASQSTIGKTLKELFLKAKDEIERLERELAARQWQPIETAPKDGTACLVFCPAQQNVCFERQDICLVSWFGERWGYFIHGGTLRQTPTHWMPPHPAPTTNKGDAS